MFGSLSYTKISENLGECVFQTDDNKFVICEVYVSCQNENFALLRYFQDVQEVFLSQDNLPCGLLFDIRNSGDLEKVSVEKLEFECIVYKRSKSSYRISVVKEGFEHN